MLRPEIEYTSSLGRRLVNSESTAGCVSLAILAIPDS